MQDDEMLQELVLESFDHLGVLEPLLLEWEQAPETADNDQINEAFRCLHTIKGGFGFFGMQNIKTLSHVMESLMMEVRDGKRSLTAEMVELLITASDVLKGLICDPATSDKLDISVTVNALETMLDASPAAGDATDAGDEELAPHPQADTDPGALVRTVYRIQVRSRADLADHHRGTLDLNHDLVAFGEIIDVRIDLSSISGLDDALLNGAGLAYEVIFACDLAADEIAGRLDIPVSQVSVVEDAGLDELAEDHHIMASGTLRQAVTASHTRRQTKSETADRPATGQADSSALAATPNEPSAPDVAAAPVPEPAVAPVAVPADTAASSAAAPLEPAAAASTASETLKVRLDVIESLMDLGGELVLCRNQMTLRFSERLLDGPLGAVLQTAVERELTEGFDQLVATADRTGDVREAINQHLGTIRDQILDGINLRLEDAPGLRTAIKDFDSVTTGLQAVVMQTRMQPVAVVFNKFTRVVRDLGRKIGKSVSLATEGSEVELDKSILDALVDPLTHLVRNGVDHAIETADERVAAGKPERGTILLRACHVSGSVRIEVIDDGRGIDPAKVKAKAIERGLVDPAQVDSMSDQAILEFIFLPGFSTAAQVTDLSGRGVGMDVVKTNIERLGGSLSIASQLGAGATFSMQIPLTLAIIPALIVRVAGKRYAVPQANLVEIVRHLDGSNKIERVHGSPVFRLRGNLLPMVHLGQQLGLSDSDDGHHILVIQTQNQPFGLVVDDILDAVEIVVRPVSRRLAAIGVIAGATILGDGSICLIADPMALADRAGIRGDNLDDPTDTTEAEAKVDEANQVLLIANPDGGRMAVSMSDILRLEKVRSSDVEGVGERKMARHRGDILPLVDIIEVLPERRTGDRALQPQAGDVLNVILVRHGENHIGLVVADIADVVEVPLERRPASRDGVAFCALINERITEFLDIERLVELAGGAEPVSLAPADAAEAGGDEDR